MADLYFATIEGAVQGTLEGDSRESAHAGKHTVYAYEYSLNIQSAGGRAAGRAQRSPITFITPRGRSSPQLMEAALRNERLSVTFEFFRPDVETGELRLAYTIQLENALITHLRDVAEIRTGTEVLPGEYEEIALSFERMEVTWVADGVTAMDDVRANV